MLTTLLADLPLFPLGTVLFPQGLLPLRVFEARYLDMARECLRKNIPFGVCLIKSGSEVARSGESVQIESVGCLAEILSCDMQQLGVLLLRCRGTSRFRLLSTRVEKDGLMRGIAEPVPGDDIADDNDTHRLRLASCAEALSRIIDTVTERDAENVPFLQPYQFGDACWVANRLAEILPISMRARQQLMELPDAGARIDIVHEYMRRHQLL